MKKFLMVLWAVTMIFGMASLVPGSEAMAAFSDFDAGLDEWTFSPSSEFSWSPTDGNPDGYVRFEDITGSPGYGFAPAKFLGDWSSLDGVGFISYDHKIFSTGYIGNNGIFPYEIEISGPTGSAIWTGLTPTGITDWITVMAPLTESAWLVTGSWSDLLSSVTELRIMIEHVDNDNSSNRDITGIDNVHLTPIPGAIWLLGSGLIGFVGTRKYFKK